MCNVWAIISRALVVVAIGGAIYHFLTAQPGAPATSNDSDAEPPAGNTRGLVVSTENPLSIANRAQFDRWIPLYPIRCGEIVFEKVDKTDRQFQGCVREIQNRVAHYTDTLITQEDVLDESVRAHWHEVTSVK
jgi:hypothetical protein